VNFFEKKHIIEVIYLRVAVLFPSFFVETKIEEICQIYSRKPPWLFLKCINIYIKYSPGRKKKT
jgi:hypothetical protein